MSVHLVSQKPPPPTVSPAAVEAFEEIVKKQQLLVDEDGWKWRDELSTNGLPSLEEFVKHWTSVLGDQSGAQEVLQAIPQLVEANPVPTIVPPKGVAYIKDLKAFRASLEVSEISGPLVEWSDLPTAKF